MSSYIENAVPIETSIDKLDLFIVVCDRDVKLLRHFFLSYRIFFKTSGKIHLLIWSKDRALLDQIDCPLNLVVHYKDEVEDLIEDDFRNQMYLKLIADQYVETEWFWVVDADYLICAPLEFDDFFSDGKPNWFYRTWLDRPEKSWRSGTQSFLGYDIPYLFMDEPQYVLSRTILREFRHHVDAKKILSSVPTPSEFIAYGAFAFENHHESYDWVDIDGAQRGRALCYKVNQRPPTYCELDERVSLLSLPEKKYFVFWSHWEKAEEKMIEFSVDAQQQAFGKVIAKPDDARLFRYWPLTAIDQGCLNGIDGLYSDGWLMRDVWFRISTDHRSIFFMELMVPGSPSGNPSPLRLFININDQQKIQDLNPGSQTLMLHLDKHSENRVSFKFEGGFAEPHGARTLFAKIGTSRLEAAERLVGLEDVAAKTTGSSYL